MVFDAFRKYDFKHRDGSTRLGKHGLRLGLTLFTAAALFAGTAFAANIVTAEEQAPKLISTTTLTPDGNAVIIGEDGRATPASGLGDYSGASAETLINPSGTSEKNSSTKVKASGAVTLAKAPGDSASYQQIAESTSAAGKTAQSTSADKTSASSASAAGNAAASKTPGGSSGSKSGAVTTVISYEPDNGATTGTPAADTSVTAASAGTPTLTTTKDGIVLASEPDNAAAKSGSSASASGASGKTQSGSAQTGALPHNDAASGTAAAASEPSDNGNAGLEDLIAKSLKNPYEIYNTDKANIVVSRGRKIDTDKPMIALTYDDGPHTPVGNRIMDVFAKYGQRCTFFMVGDRVKSRAAEVRRMAAEGHEIANHTYSHEYLNHLSASDIRSQVKKCNDVLEEVSGVRPRIMRLPGGNKNSTVLQNVDMPIILWSIDTLDWKTKDASKTKAAVIGHVKDGDIVLMHELYSATADATESIVPKLVDQGFQLVTVSELAKLKNRKLSDNVVYYDLK